MSASPTDAWVFDLDGTLVDSRVRLYGAYVEVARRRGIPILSPAELRTAIDGRTLERDLGLQERQMAESVLRDWYAEFGRNTPASPALPGALDALRACARTGAGIAIATARPIPSATVRGELMEVGLGPLIDVIATTDSVGGAHSQGGETVLSGFLTKTRQIAAALSELGVPFGRAAMVSDEPSDLLDAASLGIGRLVGVESGGTERATLAATGASVLTSVAELPATLGVAGWPGRLAEAARPGS